MFAKSLVPLAILAAAAGVHAQAIDQCINQCMIVSAIVAGCSGM